MERTGFEASTDNERGFGVAFHKAEVLSKDCHAAQRERACDDGGRFGDRIASASQRTRHIAEKETLHRFQHHRAPMSA